MTTCRFVTVWIKQVHCEQSQTLTMCQSYHWELCCTFSWQYCGAAFLKYHCWNTAEYWMFLINCLILVATLLIGLIVSLSWPGHVFNCMENFDRHLYPSGQSFCNLLKCIHILLMQNPFLRTVNVFMCSIITAAIYFIYYPLFLRL